MKKLLALVLMITVTLLCGCSAKGGAEDKAIEIRSKYLGSGELTLAADMTADYGDRVYEYSVVSQASRVPARTSRKRRNLRDGVQQGRPPKCHKGA